MPRVIVGSFAGVASPADTFSPLVGAELTLPPGTDERIPLETGYEYGLLVARGSAEVDGEPAEFGTLRYLGWGRDAVSVSTTQGATMLLLGGEPLAEELLMWWNFVGRDHEEIVAARDDWEAGRRFGAVPGDPHGRLPAPPLPGVRMKPRPSR